MNTCENLPIGVCGILCKSELKKIQNTFNKLWWTNYAQTSNYNIMLASDINRNVTSQMLWFQWLPVTVNTWFSNIHFPSLFNKLFLCRISKHDKLLKTRPLQYVFSMAFSVNFWLAKAEKHMASFIQQMTATQLIKDTAHKPASNIILLL